MARNDDYAPPLTDSDRAEIARNKERIAAERAQHKIDAAARKAALDKKMSEIMARLNRTVVD